MIYLNVLLGRDLNCFKNILNNNLLIQILICRTNNLWTSIFLLNHLNFIAESNIGRWVFRWRLLFLIFIFFSDYFLIPETWRIIKGFQRSFEFLLLDIFSLFSWLIPLYIFKEFFFLFFRMLKILKLFFYFFNLSLYFLNYFLTCLIHYF